VLHTHPDGALAQAEAPVRSGAYHVFQTIRAQALPPGYKKSGAAPGLLFANLCNTALFAEPNKVTGKHHDDKKKHNGTKDDSF